MNISLTDISNTINQCPTCETCVQDPIATLKLVLIFVWAIIIWCASYFTYQKKVPFTLAGKQRDLGWVFSKLIVAWPIIAFIIANTAFLLTK